MNVNENILLYDVFDDNKNVLNSQVILDNYIGFVIPKNYYFLYLDQQNMGKKGGFTSLFIY